MKKYSQYIVGFITGVAAVIAVAATQSENANSHTAPLQSESLVQHRHLQCGSVYQFRFKSDGAGDETGAVVSVAGAAGQWVKLESQFSGGPKYIRWINLDHVTIIIPLAEKEKATK